MPFTLEEKHEIYNQLNYAYLRILPYLAQYPAPLYTFDAQLNPAEWYANMPVPIMFEQDDIFARCDRVTSEITVSEIRSIVAELMAIEDALKKEQLSPNSAMTKADKIEWNQSERTTGMKMRRDSSIEKLRFFLKLPPSPPIGGSAMLDRS